MELANILGWLATILFSICYIPQIIKTYKTESVKGLSFLLLFISFIANIIALWYAFLIEQQPLQVKYILGLVFLLVTIGMYLRVYFKTRRVPTDEIVAEVT